jgi:hypothetical protein
MQWHTTSTNRRGIYFGRADQPAEEVNFIVLDIARVLELFYALPEQLGDQAFCLLVQRLAQVNITLGYFCRPTLKKILITMVHHTN